LVSWTAWRHLSSCKISDVARGILLYNCSFRIYHYFDYASSYGAIQSTTTVLVMIEALEARPQWPRIWLPPYIVSSDLNRSSISKLCAAAFIVLLYIPQRLSERRSRTLKPPSELFESCMEIPAWHCVLDMWLGLFVDAPPK
jgi:hypothetical protein